MVLTYTHKLFFLRLLNMAVSKGYDTQNGLAVDVSVQELSQVLNIPMRSTIQSLNRLSACGAIGRVAGEKTFPRSTTITTIEKSMYECEKEK